MNPGHAKPRTWRPSLNLFYDTVQATTEVTHRYKLLYTNGLKLKLLRRPNEDLHRGATLWRWRNNDGTGTLPETAFTSYFLRKVSWVIGESSLAFSTFV